MPDSDDSFLMFCHDRDGGAILDGLGDRPMLVVGGRGIGKSALLHWIGSRLEREYSEGVNIVNGRQAAEARKQIYAMHESPPPVVLIDDLDDIFTALKDDRPDLADSLLSVLWSLRSNQSRHASSRFLATCTIVIESPLRSRLTAKLTAITPRTALDWQIAYSRFTQNLHSHRLDPWGYKWEEQWKEDFDDVFSQRLHGGGREVWRKVILDLTGGHPALFGPAVRELNQLCADRNKKNDPGRFDLHLVAEWEDRPNSSSLGEFEDNIRNHLEEFLEINGLRPIKSAIRNLRESNDPIEANSFKALLEIARHDGAAKAPADPDARRILVDEGLSYRDKVTGRFRIPGDIIRTEVLKFATPRTPVGFGLVSLEPDSTRPNEGELWVHAASGIERIRFGGKPWRILQTLYERRGDVTSPEVLMAAAKVKDKTALKNVIQRLQITLKAYKLGHLIVNEYRRGYRLVLPLG